MKNLCVALCCIFALVVSGCRYQADQIPSNPAESVNSALSSVTESEPDKSAGSVPSAVISVPASSQAVVSAFSGFTEEEIADAKKIAEKYYKNTVFKNIIIERDTSSYVYKHYASRYQPENLIIFSVTVVKSENPPRAIVLIRADETSDWQVISEGY